MIQIFPPNTCPGKTDVKFFEKYDYFLGATCIKKKLIGGSRETYKGAGEKHRGTFCYITITMPYQRWLSIRN